MRWLPLPENRCRFAPAICRPSHQTRGLPVFGVKVPKSEKSDFGGRAGSSWRRLRLLRLRISHLRAHTLAKPVNIARIPSLHRRCIENSTIGPECVDAALDAERAVLAEIAI